jgi:hypothetical protein
MKKILLITLLLSSCGTIMKGTKSSFTLDTFPAGARVSINEEYYNKTPIVKEFKTNQDLVGRVSKKGYHQESFRIQRTISKKALLGDLIFGGIVLSPILIGIDSATGGLYNFEKKSTFIELEKKEDDIQQVHIPPFKSRLPKYKLTGDPLDSPLWRNGVVRN